MSEDDDAWVKVFVGHLQDMAFLVSLLNSGGIETRVVNGPPYGDRHRGGGMDLYVANADARDALDLIADFQANGIPKAD
jgi:hypothetical protein